MNFIYSHTNFTESIHVFLHRKLNKTKTFRPGVAPSSLTTTSLFCMYTTHASLVIPLFLSLCVIANVGQAFGSLNNLRDGCGSI